MADNDIRLNHLGGVASLPPMYSPDLQPLLQSLLATLADIDFGCEHEREKLSKRLADAHLKTRLLEKLKARYCERRQPYIEQLAILHERIQSRRQ
jgi:hypothetical protein